MEPASGPAVVVTPATPFSGINHMSGLPSISTREGLLDQALGALETEKPPVEIPADVKPKLPLPTTGTEGEMSDEIQLQVNASGDVV
ncbi:hypothetical protein C0992_006753 [Termitomyces sp. T32_za158]|nr:hypothetical protein C0992_006753 [Termitomyces sp. T32_za158]